MTSDIHPTAIVHPDARLGAGVRIGPYAVIEGPAEIGAGCVIQAHAILTGHVRMGANNTVGYGAILGADPQDHAFRPEIESFVTIGDNNVIREYVTIHRGTGPGTETRLGSHCFLMTGVHLAHNTRVDDRVTIANNVLLAGHVQIGANAFVGGGTVFHQFVRIGRNAMVGGHCAFGKDIPPFVMALRVNVVAGLNVIGLRRAGFNATQRSELKDAFALVYRSGMNTAQAVEAARDRTWGPEAAEFLAFIAGAKRRGICALSKSRHGSGGDDTEA